MGSIISCCSRKEFIFFFWKIYILVEGEVGIKYNRMEDSLKVGNRVESFKSLNFERKYYEVELEF